MSFLVNASSPKLFGSSIFKFCRCTGHMIRSVQANVLCDLGQGHIMYFLVNVSPKPLDVATSNFAGA